MFINFIIFFSIESESETYSLIIESSKKFDNYTILYQNESLLEIGEFIGSGRYSEVFKGYLNGNLVAIKKIKPIEEWRLKREVKILELLSNQSNILKLYGVFGDEYSPILVTSFHESEKTHKINYLELKWIMKSILIGINNSHSLNVLHRDIKWQNIVCNYQKKDLVIIDWGLADFYEENISYSFKVGTRSYKSPELLFEYENYSFSNDIWSCGCIMANLLFGCPSFFGSHDNDGVKNRQIRFFGSNRMRNISNKYNYKKTLPYFKPQNFLEYVLPHTRNLFNKNSLDLLEKMLMPELDQRITAKNALNHQFFN